MSDEPDLGALLARILPRLMALEEPILSEAGLSMWEYAIVTELASGTSVSQIELSRRTGRDPTRLGRHLDDLASRGLVVREQSGDHRRRSVHLTDRGRELYEHTKTRVRLAEDDFLAETLSAQDGAAVRRILALLAGSADARVAGPDEATGLR